MSNNDKYLKVTDTESGPAGEAANAPAEKTHKEGDPLLEFNTMQGLWMIL